MTSSTPPRRRWFRFSLRTLFVLVTVLGVFLGWLGWNVHQLRQRETVLQSLGLFGADQGSNTTPRPWRSMPLVWRLLGAKPVAVIYLPKIEFSEDDRARIQELFPEAGVIRYSPPHS